MEKIDAHVHVFSRHSMTFPREVSRLAPADKEATAEQLLREMDAGGIGRAVLIQMGGTRIEHHGYVAQCVEKWPDRFTAVGLVDVHDPDPPARLEELVNITGVKGIRVGNLGDPQAKRAEDLRTYGLFRHADELGININVYASSTQLHAIALLARAFPRVQISLDHLGICPSTSSVVDRWGRPRFDDEPIPPVTFSKILDLAQYPNVYIKVSGEYAFSKEPYPYGDLRPMVEHVHQVYGPKRMMWCSDFPWIAEEPGYIRLVELMHHHLPSIPRHEMDMIMGGNALKLWFQR